MNKKLKMFFRETIIVACSLLFFVSLFIKFDTPTVVAKEQNNPKYGEWIYEGESNCLISKDGTYFSKEYIKYEASETGMCKKYTRTSIK